MLRVGVLGAGGRMGSTVCDAVSRTSDLELVCAFDPAAANKFTSSAEPSGRVEISADLGVFASSGCQVAVDFTVAEAARENLPRLAEMGVNVVLGTTGLSEEELEDLGELFAGKGLGILAAANFALGAVLMEVFGILAAPFAEGVEIIEFHHEKKLDAPSGTALQSALAIERARQERGLKDLPALDARSESLAQTRGGLGPGGARIHAVRLPGFVARQDLVIGMEGQTLTISHNVIDRTAFMPGVLMAVRAVQGRPGLTRGLVPLLNLGI
jgi:4-hydroxy-tetrahydrodipicolinate reductase